MSRLVPNIASVVGMLLLVACGGGTDSSDSKATSSETDQGEVRLTWISTANWLIEAGDTRILFDAYYTRALEGAIFQGGLTADSAVFTVKPVPSDRLDVENVLNAIDYKNKKISHLLIGHSNFDHGLDMSLVAELTGARIIGPPTSCFQAEAQGIAKAQCTAVNGGEQISLAEGVTLYVIHSNHSGSPPSPVHLAGELTSPPKIDSPTTAGGFRWGVSEDMPNGGGSRVYIIKVDRSGGKSLSVAIEDSGSATGFNQPLVVQNCVATGTAACGSAVPGTTYASPSDAFQTGMKAAGLTSVDLQIGTTNAALVELEAAILRPKYFLPTHWEGIWFRANSRGLDRTFTPAAAVKTLFDNQKITLLSPGQFFDSWVLNSEGVRPVSNKDTKQKFGLPEVGVIEPTPAPTPTARP